jgi:hypothetical protein
MTERKPKLSDTRRLEAEIDISSGIEIKGELHGFLRQISENIIKHTDLGKSGPTYVTIHVTIDIKQHNPIPI